MKTKLNKLTLIRGSRRISKDKKQTNKQKRGLTFWDPHPPPQKKEEEEEEEEEENNFHLSASLISANTVSRIKRNTLE